MFSFSPRRRRLALTLIAPALAMSMNSNNRVQAENVFSQSGLESTVVQTTANEEVLTDPIVYGGQQDMAEPMAQPAPEAPIVSYHDVSTAPSCTCCNTTCCTKKKKEAATDAMKAAYGGVFYGNNFGYLNDPCYDGPAFCGEKLKNMKTPYGTWSFGGETRARFHDERNHRGLGITGNDDSFWLTRQRLYADWKVNDIFRVYGEVLDADSTGETFAPRPIEENDLDIQNLFVDVKLLDSDSGKLTARLGRQELLYGAQRTISPLDWANTRRTFEGVRMLYQSGDTSIDGFWTEFVNVDADGSDDPDNNQQFYGAYATQKNTAVGQFEAYYLGYDNDTVNFSYHTLGNRVSGKTDGGVLYDFEGAIQFGDNSNNTSHSANFFTGGLGRKVETNWLSPTVWFYYDYASGEEDFANVGRGDDGFDHLFPLAHKYNGFMDLFGRRNLHDLNVFSLTPINKKVSLILWYHYFALAEQTTPYSVVMTPFNTATQAESKDLGHEIDVLFNINLNPRNNILLGYSHFSAGDYYDTVGIGQADGDNDADFFYAQFQTRY